MRSVFVSHRRPEQADADRLGKRLGARWRLLSHPVARAASETWQHECRRLIETADAVVCIVGDTTAASPNVDWELETARRAGRPVIAMRSPHAAAPVLPAALAASGEALIEPGDVDTRLEEAVLERAG